MPAAANGEQRFMFRRDGYDLLDVGTAARTYDGRRPAVRHRIPHPPEPVIVSVIAIDDISLQVRMAQVMGQHRSVHDIPLFQWRRPCPVRA